MTQLVSGIFTDPMTAQAALQALRQHGCSADSIFELAPANDAETALTKVGLSKADVATDLKALRNGGSMIGAKANFGQASRIIKVLQAHAPAHLDVQQIHEGEVTWSNAAPFSAMFGMPTLSDDPFGFSRILGLPLLSNFSFSRWLGFRQLSDEAAPLSKAVGMKTLSTSATPFSDFFKLPTLSNNAAPFSSLFGWKLLS